MLALRFEWSPRESGWPKHRRRSSIGRDLPWSLVNSKFSGQSGQRCDSAMKDRSSADHKSGLWWTLQWLWRGFGALCSCLWRRFSSRYDLCLPSSNTSAIRSWAGYCESLSWLQIMEAILALSACLFCLLGYSVYSFKRNFDRVKHLNIPKVYNPLCPSNILWLLLQPALLPLLQLLPYDTRKWLRYSKWGWEYEDRYQTHAELGDVWMQVTPSMNWVYVADANLVNEIFHRREDFRRPRQLYCMRVLLLSCLAKLTRWIAMLDIFGPNLGTVEGLDWQRHRKITGAAFNEQSYGIVWNESIRQADGVLQWWTSEEPHAINTTARDVRAVSLNILAFAGFRKQYPFDGKIENVSTQDAPSFRQTLCFVLDNSLLTMLIPAKLLRFPLLPSSWKQIGKAIDSLRNHMLIRYNEEKSQSTKESGQTENLMSVMVRASEEATYAADTEIKKSPSDPLAPKRLGLTMNEIFGNIFVYYFAGHDTTAAVFAYTMYLLAAYPDVQDWVTEELQQILPSTDDSPWLYEELFPRLKRCLALLVSTVLLREATECCSHCWSARNYPPLRSDSGPT